MIDRLEILKTRLQNTYSLAIATLDEKHFFLWLYDYVKVFDKESELSGFATLVDNERADDHQRMGELTPLAIKEIETVYKKVAKYVKDKKITHDVIVKELDEYVMAKDGRYTSSRGHLEDLYDKLSYTLMTMVEDGTEEDLKFAQGFGIVSDKRRITEWTFSPSYTEFEILKSGLKKIQETRLWYSWSKVVLAYQAINDHSRATLRELYEGNKHFEALNWSGMQSEMMGIIDEKNNSNSKAYEFISKDYRYYLAKVHIRAVEFLQAGPTVEKIIHTDSGLSDPDIESFDVRWTLSITSLEAIILIGKLVFNFSMTDRTGKTIQYLASRKSTVSWDQVYKKWSGQESTIAESSKDKEKVYWTVNAINKRIFDKTSIPDFISYKSGQLTFNTSYIRLPDDTRI